MTGPVANDRVRPLAQLTYASTQAPGGRGGWQVIESSGDLAPAAKAALVERATTHLEGTMALPRFPTAEQLAEAPRCLQIGSLSAASAAVAVWHAAPAGTDITGRPGNVFSHCALIARGPLSPRPIALWRSASWLTPFGAAEVGTAELPEILTPGLDVAEVSSAFILDERVWRKGTLAVVLDSVRAAFLGGPTVVLLTETTSSAAFWIAAVSACTTPVGAQHLAFSTAETPGTHETWLARGLHIVAMPHILGEGLRGIRDVVVVDVEEDVELGDWGGAPHRTARGDEVVVTGWSVMMLESFTDADSVSAMVGRLDDLGARLPTESRDPAWAMAVVLALSDPETIPPHIAEILAFGAPSGVEDEPDVYQLVCRCLADQLGRSTAERWSALTTLTRNGAPDVTRRLAEVGYAEAALVDDAWLARPDQGTPWLPQPDPGRVLPTELIQVVHDALRGAPSPGLSPVETARRGVRLLDLAERLRSITDEPMQELALTFAELHVKPALMTPGAAQDLAATTHWAEPLTQDRLSACISMGDPSIPIPVATLRWLGHEDGHYLADEHRLLDGGREIDQLTASLGWLVVDSPPATFIPELVPRARLAVAVTLSDGRPLPDLERDRALEMLTEHPLSAEKVAALLAEFGTSVPTEVVSSAALAHPNSPELRSLLDAMRAHGRWSALATARQLVDDPVAAWGSAAYRRAIIEPIAGAVAGLRYRSPALSLDANLAAAAVLITTLSVLQDEGAPGELLEFLAHGAVGAAEIRRAAEGYRARLRGDAAHLVDSALRQLVTGHPRSPLVRTDTSIAQVFATSSTPQGELIPELLLADVLATGDPGQIDRGVQDMVGEVTAQAPRLRREIERFLRGWLKDHQIESKARGGGLGFLLPGRNRQES